MKENLAIKRLKYYLDLNGIDYEMHSDQMYCHGVTVMEGMLEEENLTVCYFDDGEMYVETMSVVDTVELIKGFIADDGIRS
ncbi:MAG: hypothetical protein ACI4R8_01250 [Candidatus Caccovivens sp.]